MQGRLVSHNLRCVHVNRTLWYYANIDAKHFEGTTSKQAIYGPAHCNDTSMIRLCSGAVVCDAFVLLLATATISTVLEVVLELYV